MTGAMVRDDSLIRRFCVMRKMVIVYDVLIIPCPCQLYLLESSMREEYQCSLSERAQKRGPRLAGSNIYILSRAMLDLGLAWIWRAHKGVGFW